MIKPAVYLPVLACALLVGVLPAQMATRGPEVERLSLLVGTFEGEVLYSPPGAPAQVGRMTYQGEWDLDGWIVRSRYEQRIGKAPTISGLLIYRWRPSDSTYAFEAYANTPMEPHRLNGTWTDGLVFEGRMMGMPLRERWQARGADTLVTSMEFEQNGIWARVSQAILIRRK